MATVGDLFRKRTVVFLALVFVGITIGGVLQTRVRFRHIFPSAINSWVLPFDWRNDLPSQDNVTIASDDVTQPSSGATNPGGKTSAHIMTSLVTQKSQKMTHSLENDVIQPVRSKAGDSAIPGSTQIVVTSSGSNKTFTASSGFVQTVNSTPATTENNSRKTIVYLCNSFGCGGLADRQKGIVSAFVLAAMLKRNFKVHVTVPCDLANFMQPNKIDWRITPEEIRRADLQTVGVIDEKGVTYATGLLKKDDLDREFPHNFTAFHWNMELVQYLRQHRLAKGIPWLEGSSVPDVYRYVLDTLFSLAPDLQKALQDFRKDAPEDSKLVCAQIRLGEQAGFSDSEKYYTTAQFPTVSSFLESYNDTDRYRFLVTSDSKEIVAMTETNFPNQTLTIPGPITHVDKSRGANICDGFKKAILDEYALATCDVLVISESGLGKVAAFRRGTDDDLFLFLGQEIKPFTRDSPFPKNKKSWR